MFLVVNRRCRLALLGVLFLSNSAVAQGSRAEAEAFVEHIFTKKHGLSPLAYPGEQFEALRDSLRANADIYLSVLEAHIVYPPLDSLEAYVLLAPRFSAIADFLIVLGDARSRQLLITMFEGVTQQLEALQAWNQKVEVPDEKRRLGLGVEILGTMQRTLLQALFALADTTLLPYALERYEQSDRATKERLLEYIRGFRYRDQQIQAWLERRGL